MMTSYHRDILASAREGSALSLRIEELGIARLEQLRTQTKVRLDLIDAALRAAHTVPVIDVGD